MGNNYKIRPFSIKTNGNKLRGFVMKPKKHGKHDAVIISHGFNSNMAISYGYAKPFAEAGYAVFCYDFPMSGSGISGGDSRNMSVITEKDDLINLVHYVKKQKYVNKKHITLAGCSQGGFVSALAAAEIEDEIQNIILYYPALCIPDDARRGQLITAKIDPDNVPDEYMAIAVKLGKKYALDAQKLDPYKEICTYKKPVYIIHGKEDKLVSIDYSRKAAELYPNARLDEIHGDHGFILFGARKSKKLTRKYIKKEMKKM